MSSSTSSSTSAAKVPPGFTTTFMDIQGTKKSKFKASDYKKLFAIAQNTDEKTKSLSLLNSKVTSKINARKKHHWIIRRIMKIFYCVFDSLNLTQVGKARRLLRDEINNVFVHVIKNGSKLEEVNSLVKSLEWVEDPYFYGKVSKNIDAKDLLNQREISLKLHSIGFKPINFLEILKGKNKEIERYIKPGTGYDHDAIYCTYTYWNKIEVSLFQLFVLEKKFDLIDKILSDFEKRSKNDNIISLLYESLKIGKKDYLFGAMELTKKIGISWKTDANCINIINTENISEEDLEGLSLLVKWHNKYATGCSVYISKPYYSFCNIDESTLKLKDTNRKAFLDKINYKPKT